MNYTPLYELFVFYLIIFAGLLHFKDEIGWERAGSIYLGFI